MSKNQTMWSSEELNTLRKAIQEERPIKEVAQLFPNRTFNSVNVKWKRERKAFSESKNNFLDPEVEQDIKDRAKETRAKETDRKYKSLLKSYARLEDMLDTFQQTREIHAERIKTKMSSISDVTAFMVASDWHCAKRVVSGRINGLNSFNLSIFEKRSQNFFINGVTLLKQFEKNNKINTICLALLGDFMENFIHEEQPENNTLLPIEEMLKVQDTLASGIKYLLDHTNKNIYIPCCVGNHSRKTAKIHVATEVKNSFEWAIYCNLAKYFENNDRVMFDIAEGAILYHNFYGYNIRFLHGTEIKYNGGVGGIFVSGNKAIMQWNKAKYADLTVFGHFHQTKYSGWGGFICNGSLCGYDEYALSLKADYERPQQTFFLLDKERGLTIQTPILLDQN